MRGTSGRGSQTLSAFYDPDTSCWRTSQGTLGEGSILSSQTWTDSGMWAHGHVSGPLMWEPLTSVNGYSSTLLPTPDASAHKYRLGGGASNPRASKLGHDEVSLLPTPTARDHKDGLTARHAVTGKADLLPRAIGAMIDDQS